MSTTYESAKELEPRAIAQSSLNVVLPETNPNDLQYNLNVAEGQMLFESIIQNPQRTVNYPLIGAVIEDTTANIKQYRFFSSSTIEDGADEFIDTLGPLPPEESHIGVYQKDNLLYVISSKGLIRTIKDAKHQKQESWCIVRGKKTETQDNRSFQKHIFFGKSEPVKFLGSITIETAALFKARKENIAKTSNSSLMPAWLNGSILNPKEWEKITTTKSTKYIYEPRLVPGQVLVGQLEDETILMLGRIRFMSI